MNLQKTLDDLITSMSKFADIAFEHRTDISILGKSVSNLFDTVKNQDKEINRLKVEIVSLNIRTDLLIKRLPKED